jgi:hypothetical protein
VAFAHDVRDHPHVGAGLQIALEGLDRRCEDAIGIAGRQPDADRAHINAKPDPCPHPLSDPP